jgi:hypothetical protein
VALVVEGSAPGAALFMVRKGAIEESRDGTHVAYLGRGATFNAKVSWPTFGGNVFVVVLWQMFFGN